MKLKPPKVGGVLVLPAAGDLQIDALDLVGQLGDLVVRERDLASQSRNEADERGDERRRGAEPAARRGVGMDEQIESAGESALAPGRAAPIGPRK